MEIAILLHGTGGSSKDYFWFADTKKFLEEHGYTVWWPQLPHTERPELIETEDFIADNWPDMNEETIIIGHSSACPLILDLLRWLKIEIKQTVLVAGFYQSLDDDGYSDLMLSKDFNFKESAKHTKEIIMINSDNDPWGCDDKQARPTAEKLGAKFVLAKGQGHMGSLTYNQPYKEFPALKKLLKV